MPHVYRADLDGKRASTLTTLWQYLREEKIPLQMRDLCMHNATYASAAIL
jgi:hypothetical protein